MILEDVIGPAAYLPGYTTRETDVNLIAFEATPFLTFEATRVLFFCTFDFAFSDTRVWPSSAVTSALGVLIDSTVRFELFNWEDYGHAIQLPWYGFSDSGVATFRTFEVFFDPGRLQPPLE